MARRQKNRRGWSARFVRLDHFMLKTPAWRSLSPAAVAVYVALAMRYNGINNGDIGMAVREAAELANVALGTAARALKELQETGLIKLTERGSFSTKVRHSSRWALTSCPVDSAPATKEYATWRPAPKLKAKGRPKLPGRNMAGVVLQ